jgi:hypothetical protein
LRRSAYYLHRLWRPNLVNSLPRSMVELLGIFQHANKHRRPMDSDMFRSCNIPSVVIARLDGFVQGRLFIIWRMSQVDNGLLDRIVLNVSTLLKLLAFIVFLFRPRSPSFAKDSREFRNPVFYVASGQGQRVIHQESSFHTPPSNVGSEVAATLSSLAEVPSVPRSATAIITSGDSS